MQIRINFISGFILLIFVSISLNIYSQNPDKVLCVGKSKVFTEGVLNEYIINESFSQNVKFDQLRNEILKLKAEYATKDDYINPEEDHPVFELPVRLIELSNDPGFYTITAYLDHDTIYPNQLLDYNCVNLTYDLEIGYNHSGTDFFSWPFPWYKMYNDEVEVVAAAPGILYFKQDGNNDQQCELNNDPSNSVAILHEDGSTSWYVHLKKNSVTGKFVGEEIEAGEYLGIVGSSGSSNAPHLHFEVFDAEGNLIDPFYGPCNDNIEESWWLSQIPYKDPGINRIASNNHLPYFPECPEQEVPNETNIFYPGDSIYLLSYFRNVSIDDEIMVTVNRPDNSLFASWIWSSPWEFYSASWLYFLMFLEEEQLGEWKYAIQYKEIHYEHSFQLLDPQNVESEGFSNNLIIYPIPCKDHVTVVFESKKPYQIEFINNVGCRSFCEDFQNNGGSPQTINISNLIPGIYVVKISTSSKTVYSKMIKL